MTAISVDFTKTVRVMKPVHAIGQPPIMGWSNDSLFHFLTEAGIPYSRLHDTGGAFGAGRFVDIPNVFRDFDADPDDPASYDFTWTDPLITSLVNAKVEPYYRLGVTIENEVWRKAYHVNPPKDFTKWAKICAGVIRHYTQGWANGFHYKMTYWEIWNEPDCGSLRNMWTGTWEQYLELYKTASKLLKAEFPEIKIGGYASCGFYALIHPEYKGDELRENFITSFERFLAFVSENQCPLDFFSWHSYDAPNTVVFYADYVDRKLKEYGFSGVEQHLNEWNYKHALRGKAYHSAAAAAFILEMQRSKVDIGMFYDGRCGTSSYGGLFNPMTWQPLKAYWAFTSFNELYRLKNEVFSSSDTENVYVCAAAAQDEGAVMIVNFTEKECPVELDLGDRTITSCRLTDEAFDFAPVTFRNALPPNSVILLTVRPLREKKNRK